MFYFWCLGSQPTSGYQEAYKQKMEKYLCCLLAVFLLSTFAQLAQASEDSKQNSEIQARDGTISLNGNNAWWTGAIYIVPILLIIVLLDFAIFGTFASRADELNPVSKFFFHARNGLHLLRNKRRRQYQEKYYKRVQRFSNRKKKLFYLYLLT